MRISDWSSDVCSSDLWQASGGPVAEAENCRSAERAGKPRTWVAEKLPSGPATGDGRAGRAHGQEKALRAGRPAGRAGHGPRRRWRARLSGNGVGQEIGRASCRESVCQHVYLTGVAVSSKNKNRTGSRSNTALPQQTRVQACPKTTPK